MISPGRRSRWRSSCSPRVRLERVQPLAEQLDLHRLRRPGEIIDDVRQNLDELDMQARHRRIDGITYVVHDREDVPRAAARRSEPRGDVARVLCGREQAELGPGAP